MSTQLSPRDELAAQWAAILIRQATGTEPSLEECQQAALAISVRDRSAPPGAEEREGAA